jgi:hypothetical protein
MAGIRPLRDRRAGSAGNTGGDAEAHAELTPHRAFRAGCSQGHGADARLDSDRREAETRRISWRYDGMRASRPRL